METSRTNAQYRRNDRYSFLYAIEWILSVLWIFFVRQTRQIQGYGNQALWKSWSVSRNKHCIGRKSYLHVTRCGGFLVVIQSRLHDFIKSAITNSLGLLQKERKTSSSICFASRLARFNVIARCDWTKHLKPVLTFNGLFSLAPALYPGFLTFLAFDWFI